MVIHSHCAQGYIEGYSGDGHLVADIRALGVWIGPIHSVSDTGLMVHPGFYDQSDTVIRVLVQLPPNGRVPVHSKQYYIPRISITDRLEDGHGLVPIDGGERLYRYKWGPALTKGSLYYTFYSLHYSSLHIYQCRECIATSTPSTAGHRPWVTYESILKHLTYDEIYPALAGDIDRQASNPGTIQLYAS